MSKYLLTHFHLLAFRRFDLRSKHLSLQSRKPMQPGANFDRSIRIAWLVHGVCDGARRSAERLALPQARLLRRRGLRRSAASLHFYPAILLIERRAMAAPCEQKLGDPAVARRRRGLLRARRVRGA
jgi:hypothetical protein